MPISDVAPSIGVAVASLVGFVAASLVGVASLPKILKLVIAEAKKVKGFKTLSEELVSTMERLVPIVKEIDLMQERMDPGKGELKVLIKTMQRAEEMIRKCSRLEWYHIVQKALYTREIKGINQDILSFCKYELQLIQHRNQLQSMRLMASVSRRINLLSDTKKKIKEPFIVPPLKEVTVSWLDQPLRKLKKMLFEDEVVTVVVSAPSACGKTMLATKLCHDADVKGKFKQIFFITVSKAPNVRLIVKRLLEHTGCKANEFANNLDTKLCIQQLLKDLRQDGPILLVLDDVLPEEEALLDKFLIQLPDYKILVTSRFEFPRFGPTYHLEPLIDENVKNLFLECVPQPNCQLCAKRDHPLQKILKGSNGFPLAMSPTCSICNCCNSVIEDERPINVLGVLWHPECFCCDACHKPIAIHDVENHVSNSRGKYHKSCYRKHRRPICYVCKEKIPLTAEGIRYNEHLFWKEKYCPFHEDDGTPMCCSCERLESKGTNYAMLSDGRRLCLECRESAVMDTYECQPLHVEIREFFRGLKMKVEKDFPLLLVEKQALNKAEKEEMMQDHYYEVVTRGLCLSKELIISSVRPSLELNNLDMATESQELVRRCEVTAILIIYGLPRLLTGYILAHEMMHAYLRLNGYRNLNEVLEEGICQVLGHMWLESQTHASKKGKCSGFEKKLVEFCKHQIETDDSLIYGLGFKKVNKMFLNNCYSLHDTLKEIANASKTLPDLKFSRRSYRPLN